MYSNVALNISEEDRKLLSQREVLEGAPIAPSVGPDAIKTTEIGAPLLINYDQLKDKEAFTRDKREVVSPTLKTLGGKVVAKFYPTAEFWAVFHGEFCWSCDWIYLEDEWDAVQMALKQQLCTRCFSPRGRHVLENHPIEFAPLADFDNQIVDEEAKYEEQQEKAAKENALRTSV